MKLVVDSNVFIAAILVPGLTRKLWFHDDIELFAPQDLLEEANEHEGELRAKFRGHQEAYAVLKRILFSRVRKISDEDLDRYAEATSVLSTDVDDRVFLAAALHVGCDIWSNDTDLKRQRRVRVWTTEELARNFQLIAERK